MQFHVRTHTVHDEPPLIYGIIVRFGDVLFPYYHNKCINQHFLLFLTLVMLLSLGENHTFNTVL